MEDPVSRSPRKGRYKKGSRPAIPWREIEVEYVFGSTAAEGENGTAGRTRISMRALSEKFGVSRSLIGYFAKKHNWRKRREKFLSGINAEVQPRAAKAGARPATRSISDLERLLDKFVGKFESALHDDRVPVPSIADVAAAVRLKQAIGETRARKESRNDDLPSLEELQRLNAESRAARAAPAEARGVLVDLCARCREELARAEPAPKPVAETPPDELKVPHESRNSPESDDENSRG